MECWVLKLHRFAHPAEATRRLGGLEAWWHGGLEAWRQGSLRQAIGEWVDGRIELLHDSWQGEVHI